MTMLDDLGGKGANLVRLRHAGFPVPPFTVIPTSEYRAFCAEHGLTAVIADALQHDAATASEIIRDAFRRPVDRAQRARLGALVGDLADHLMAVRSSATAEDLPEASFAGQQDTFLNVTREDLIERIVACWSSLWSERAITYRVRNDIPHDEVSLAVVVQQMVAAEASGVLFTADPLTGRRDRVVIDAVAGLGEQLVSGQVTPDHLEVNAAGAVTRDERGHAALTDEQACALADLGRRVEAQFGGPQDIEWTRVGDDLQLVQSRAITSLYPLPAGPREALWLSFGGIQGVLDPLTPLGADLLTALLAGAAGAFGRRVDRRTNPFFKQAGQRLWIRVDRVFSGPLQPSFLTVLPAAEPVGAAVLTSLASEPAYARRTDRAAVRHAASLAARFAGPALPRLVRNLADPDAARARFVRDTDALLVRLAARLDEASRLSDPGERLAARRSITEATLAGLMGELLPRFAPIMGPGMAALQRLRALARETDLPNAEALAVSITRSLPGNVTTEMDLALAAAARRIAADPDAHAALAREPAVVAADYAAGTLPPVAQEGLADFLDRYGMRGVAEIDLGTPRWHDRPDGVISTIQTYLTQADPGITYEAGRREAEAAIDTLAADLPPLKAAQVRFLGRALRGLFGLRESPKFVIVRALGLLREALLASGQDLVDADRLDTASDVFFLTLDELALAFHADRRPLVKQRRAERERELRRAQVPVLIVGDGRTFHTALTSPDAVADLVGTGVSPGVATGRVRVVSDPARADLEPGEILVCRGTDPAWTPLFLTASGLITEVGGLMTHGAVVAREYGLPAVVGVPGATTALITGEVVEIDGAAGTIVRHLTD